jgi:F-type H+-transporting ATPase subunit beta
VAEQFTGLEGKYVPVEQTVASFKEILEGKHDDIPERAFLLKGTIDEVVAAAGGAREEEKESEGEGSDEDNGDEQEGSDNGDSDGSDDNGSDSDGNGEDDKE